MNLSDGTVLCGRKFFDGTGGNNHAVEHYQATGNLMCFVFLFLFRKKDWSFFTAFMIVLFRVSFGCETGHNFKRRQSRCV